MTPRSAIPIPQIPHITFLCGGPPLLRTEVANILSDIVPSAQAHSFAAPIRDGVLGTFFMGDPSIDVSKLTHLPILPQNNSPTFGDFISAFSQFMASFFANPSIIGLLAARRIEENRDYFDRFIFDDADTKENMRLIADIFGREHALIINFVSPSFTSQSMRVIDLPSDLNSPLPIIEYLASSLNPKPEPSTRPLPNLVSKADDIL